MTEKKENILKAALELFAEEGFKSTSTSKVAKRAGVSEGLIFRHFGNKDGLLEAILKEGEARAKTLFADLVMESDPVRVIMKAIELGKHVQKSPSEADFWKLQYKIKWELEEYGAYKVDPLRLALERAFESLAYENPKQEAQLILSLMDGMATRYFLDETFDYAAMVAHVTKKYER